MPAGRRCHATWIAALVAVSLAACGRVAPYFAPVPEVPTGTLFVTSSPSGANIELDGVLTGQVTPDTVRKVAAGRHVVRALRNGWAAAPDSVVIDVAAHALAHADFLLTAIQPPPAPVVVLEGFSNVDCVGCPQMSSMVHSLMSEPGLGLDRVVLVKYAANWPALDDPHYQTSTSANDARMSFYSPYLLGGIPTLVVNGAISGASGVPPTLSNLRDQVSALLQADPGFGIELTAVLQPGGTRVSATATLRAARAVSHSNTVVQFALIQDPVVYTRAPGSQGELVFHSIMRDFATAPGSPLPLAAQGTAVRAASLDCQAVWPVADLEVVAFVQDTQTREILQAVHADVTTSAARTRLAPSVSPIPIIGTPTPPSPGSRKGSAISVPQQRGRP